ncbi:uncharacterized protein A1O9_08911 [Exophiala aquamarina CBS 119918]|uniref:Uncharacterized protein n=1 Tax=Exophiala aquamarina CBS 119918 TaxID=1182545 RepID=A0A072P6D6_9EURO|nr:uncharacterized protein A1O9_08911 [Exophiala aquamarina CBS 119918]KEF55257.1 hypothetical protein A1O9_08911 [Exophiala aquamarina CBS 119918]
MSTLTNSPPNASANSVSSFSPIPSPPLAAEMIKLPPSPLEGEHNLFFSPPPASPIQVTFDSATKRSPNPAQFITPSRPRAGSPQRKIRPLSASGIAGMPPPMQRAHSSPGVDSSGRYVTPYGSARRPISPLPMARRRSPLRSAMEEPYPGAPSWSGLSIEPNIPENEELELSELDLSQQSPMSSFSNTFPRSRRRTTSPLHQSASAPSLHSRAMSPGISGSTSPLPLGTPQKYTNEPYPMYSFSSASSIPSTPTSIRSRSPSISSLETIEDIPDAEEAAMLEDEEGKQRGEDGEPRRVSMELRGSNLRSNKERKRWSVCGAERRADFSLEPIEE